MPAPAVAVVAGGGAAAGGTAAAGGAASGSAAGATAAGGASRKKVLGAAGAGLLAGGGNSTSRQEGRMNDMARNSADTGHQFGKAMDAAWRMLIKERKSPEAMQHKREYDKTYESTPERVKYRVDLNRERRRRGIMGSRDHMDVSHTEGGKLTLEPEHSNRARHFKEQGTLRRLAKSAKDDIELLRNLLQGPMDEQDRLIATKLAENIKEKDDSEAEMAGEDDYQHLVRPSHD